MASISDIAPLNTTAQTGGENVKAEITKLAKVIIKSSTEGLKTATQTVVGSVPKMISDLTREIESGPIDKFAVHMNKLVKLVDKLGINLGEYNKKLGATVDKFRTTQENNQEKLQKLREKGWKVELDQKTNQIKILTEKEAKAIEDQTDKRADLIKFGEEKREKLKADLQKPEDEKTNKLLGNREARQKKIEENEERIVKLKQKQAEDQEKIDPLKTAGTGGSLGDQPGFGKIAELKEAFMIIPDTISEVFGGVKNIGKIIGKQFKGFLGKPMQTIARVFKNIGTMFRTFRILIALKILAIVAAIQFVIEKIGFLIEPIQKVWDAITGFFKKIGDWFRNSWLGKKLGLADDDEVEKTIDDKASESAGELKDLYIKKHGEEEGTKLYNEWESKQDFGKTKIKPKGRARRFETKKADIVPLESDQDMSEKHISTQRSRGGGKKFFQKKKEVTGAVSEIDGATPKVLKELEAEHMKELHKSVIQVNNNSNVQQSNNSGSTTTGFIDHEPDTSFKYIRNNNSDSTWI